MKDTTLGRRALLGAGLAASFPAMPALAAYPERPLRWIVAYAAGGGTDTLARLVGANLSQRLGQPVVIENRPGAATNIGAEAVAKSLPDGYTVFSADNGTLVFNTALFKRLPYDPVRDFRPVGLMARFPLFLAVNDKAQAGTAQALIARARLAPGTIDCATAGIGSPHHLALERMAREAGVRFNHVPYRGAAPAVTDLLAGTIPMMVLDYPSGVEHLRSGRIKALAVLSGRSLEDMPAVPTVEASLGLRGFEAYAWQGLVVPKATPDALVAQLTTALDTSMRDTAVRTKLQQIGLEALTGGPVEFEALLERERATWLPLIRDLSITLD
ncbi:Bug family tripartite tricarboxylate transporter substrate binding protein [Roseomonas xinghualingensis]|uniref:Bug family tripartite tricarboxylate transporter substrate binding protein n=1 Tax=Roseomonas xinghualingensis TaxID=2986475 RepID=UPI0021F12E8E|nr:tripartite tricarboxylate transporter substrate binding protein [Roseomonas sp. SXEYE001]MCV4207240.1 tripartite tricarboxylate transporter substrate binding protein [Roseomonas sp. SXEYE001]